MSRFSLIFECKNPSSPYVYWDHYENHWRRHSYTYGILPVFFKIRMRHLAPQSRAPKAITTNINITSINIINIDRQTVETSCGNLWLTDKIKKRLLLASAAYAENMSKHFPWHSECELNKKATRLDACFVAKRSDVPIW